MAYATLYQKNDYTPPDKFRLTQNSIRTEEAFEFTVSLLPDETQYEERPLLVDDLPALMAEVRALMQTGPRPNIPSEFFGPALRRLNPVRAEHERAGIVVWMGGKVGYSLTPDAAGGVLINQAWLSGTDYPGIQRIEKM